MVFLLDGSEYFTRMCSNTGNSIFLILLFTLTALKADKNRPHLGRAFSHGQGSPINLRITKRWFQAWCFY